MAQRRRGWTPRDEMGDVDEVSPAFPVAKTFPEACSPGGSHSCLSLPFPTTSPAYLPSLPGLPRGCLCPHLCSQNPCLSPMWPLHPGDVPAPSHAAAPGPWAPSRQDPAALRSSCLCTERGPVKCLVSNTRLNNVGTIGGTLGGKGPPSSPRPLSYPMPDALGWTPRMLGSHCHPRQLSPLPEGGECLP